LFPFNYNEYIGGTLNIENNVIPADQTRLKLVLIGWHREHEVTEVTSGTRLALLGSTRLYEQL